MTAAGSSVDAPSDAGRARFLLRLPSRELLVVFVREASWVTCLWLFVYGGASWLTGLHDYRVRLWTEFDLAIPFVPAATAVYLSLFPLMWLSPFVLHTRDSLQSFAKSLAWTIGLSGVGFLLLPGDQVHATPVVTGVFGSLYTIEDRLNLNYNFLPSLHVGMAVVCGVAYGRVVSTRAAAFFWLWVAAIALSTLLTHEHYIVDVVTGGLLGFLIATRCIRSASRLGAIR